MADVVQTWLFDFADENILEQLVVELARSNKFLDMVFSAENDQVTQTQVTVVVPLGNCDHNSNWCLIRNYNG